MTWQNGGSSRTCTPAWKRLKRQARVVLDYECARCGVDGGDAHLDLDHITPVAEGGQDVLENAQWLCVPCHIPKTQAEAKRGRSRAAKAGARTRSGKRAPRVHPSDVLSGAANV